jgi:hypothetical protein
VKDYITIGSSPTGELCAQVGSDNYEARARKECVAFKNQLLRVFPNIPDGTYLSVKSFPHDFGSYLEVVCWYDNEDEDSRNYAYNMNTPEYWDDEAKKEVANVKTKVNNN